ncbi:MAG: hypothetical protein GX576_09335 [Thauera phenolivorans]|uniref:Uncharacterized protein n=1 Tax=Thauera phenolivorans TaxID=1792543 RepID=A0A7X7LWB4_9RHOO|nr:hypothetical protein [Thauera phenolivorans]NLF54574.1 hypothetical protein [Thauera phenolivorans]
MTQSKSERTEQRRRILRAAASAPVILTLPSGAALAATSVTCAQKSQELAQNSPPAGVAAAPDNWMRFKVDVYSFTGSVSATSTSAFLDASATGSADAVASAAPAAQKELYFTLSSQWYRVLADGTADPVALSAANNKPIGELAKPEGERFVLVDYAAYQAGISQTLYVYPTSSPVINPISGASCWNSLTGATLTSTVIN